MIGINGEGVEAVVMDLSEAVSDTASIEEKFVSGVLIGIGGPAGDDQAGLGNFGKWIG